MAKRVWTKEMIETLEDMDGRGLSLHAMALYFDKSPDAIKAAIRRTASLPQRNIALRKVKPHQEAEFIQQWLDDVPTCQMAIHWDMSNCSVRDTAKRLGLAPRYVINRTVPPNAVDIWPNDIRFEDDPRAVAEPFSFRVAMDTGAMGATPFSNKNRRKPPKTQGTDCDARNFLL